MDLESSVKWPVKLVKISVLWYKKYDSNIDLLQILNDSLDLLIFF